MYVQVYVLFINKYSRMLKIKRMWKLKSRTLYVEDLVADEAAEEALHALLCYNTVRSIPV